MSHITPINTLSFNGKFQRIIDPDHEEQVLKVLRSKPKDELDTIEAKLTELKRDTVKLLPADDTINVHFMPVERTYGPNSLMDYAKVVLGKFKPRVEDDVHITAEYVPGTKSSQIFIAHKRAGGAIQSFAREISDRIKANKETQKAWKELVKYTDEKVAKKKKEAAQLQAAKDKQIANITGKTSESKQTETKN